MKTFNKLGKRLVVAVLIAGLGTASAVADDSETIGKHPDVQSAVTLWSEWMRYDAQIQRVPAVSWGVVHDQELIASGAFGLANPETGREATTDTLYSICSISKLFTSVALMQQREAGRVRLDAPVADYLDWFDIEDIHSDDEPITVRGILTHSAGLPRESDYPYWTDPTHPFPTQAQIRERLGEQQTLYPASRHWQYSNLGLTLVGEIVEAVSGQAYAEYMREHLLDPLGMDDTTVDMPQQLRGDRLAIGHTALKRDGTRDVVAAYQTRGIAPAAGYASSVNDLARFASWQFRTLDGEDVGLLRAASLREMQRVHWVDQDFEMTWGLGFSVRREGNRTFARHGGGCPGYFTEFRLEPASRLGVIVLTNAIGSNPGHYAAQAFELIGPAVKQALEADAAVPEPNDSLAAYAGVYGTIWGQTLIVPRGDDLTMLALGGDSPAGALETLRHVEDHTFRRVRSDGSLGETVRFELDDDGVARRMQRHSGFQERIDG
ncbi:MAG: serine hydrolase [Wenzhouxiangella sp.]|jgi:CubicO group peptidase (beta-lactamase class C family)|nr:serine hydrolase [Wenzhouxiangella sp.]